MLPHLTRYLLQYKTVGIPHVGTLRLAQEPAQLNVADKLIHPPVFSLELVEDEPVCGHQLQFLKAASGKTDDESLQDLQSFGRHFRQKMEAGGFDWDGLGTITAGVKSFPVKTTALDAVPAQKVLRNDADHAVLVGDRQTTSSQLAEERRGEETKTKRSGLITAAWVLFVLAVLFIAFWLFFKKFNTNAAGSGWPATGFVLPVTGF